MRCCTNALLALLFSVLSTTFAQTTQSDTVKKFIEDDHLSPVASALGRFPYVSDNKADPKAKVYFLIVAASTCTISKGELIKMNTLYQTIRSKGAEVVMLSIDNRVEETKNLIDKEKLVIPALAPGWKRAEMPFPYDWMPNAPTLNVTLMVALDAQGNKLGQASREHAHALPELLSPYMDAKSKGSPLAEVLKARTTLTSAKINTKAKAYILMLSDGTESELKEVSKAYSGMKGKGVELIMFYTGTDKEGLAEWAKKSKVRFPVLPVSDVELTPFHHTERNTPLASMAIDSNCHFLGQSDKDNPVAFIKNWKKLLTPTGKEQPEP